ncbi:MAG: sulfite exporter TauE/SafE family protein, partial [Pseudomonadota bacterium]|nr:sulfite exporter TauE/SafE family protein [Pseudomonadota bacterium]
AVPGTIGYIVSGWGLPGLPVFSLGYVNVAGFAAIVVTSMWFAPLGARKAHSIEPRTLRLLFGIFLTITSSKMLFDSYRLLS